MLSGNREQTTVSNAGNMPLSVFTDLFFRPLFELFVMGPAGAWGFGGLVVLLTISGYQATPGHEFIHLGWPKSVYFLIAGAAGATVGAINARRRLPGMVAGAVAALGALWAIAFLFEHVPEIPANRIWAWVSVIALAFGIVPGLVMYGLFDRFLPRPARVETSRPGTDAGGEKEAGPAHG